MKQSNLKGFSLLSKIRARMKNRQSAVPIELLMAINNCSNMEQLKELLFSCKDLDAASLKAFDKRIEELQKEH